MFKYAILILFLCLNAQAEWVQKDTNGAIIGHLGAVCPTSFVDTGGVAYSGLPGDWTADQLGAIGIFQIPDPIPSPAPSPTPTIYTQAQLLQRLTTAYNSYIAQKVSGPGIGVLTMGVLAHGPNSLIMHDWVSKVSVDYFNREQLVTGPGPLSSLNLDFSNNGLPSVTIWQCAAEIGALPSPTPSDSP